MLVFQLAEMLVLVLAKILLFEMVGKLLFLLFRNASCFYWRKH